MKHAETNFDRYLARKRTDAQFSAAFAEADQAWDIALQLAALRQARWLTQQQVADRLEDPAYSGHRLTMVRRYVEALGAKLAVKIALAEAAAEYTVESS